MTRTTKAQVESKFRYLIETIGGHEAASYQDVGGYQLDNNPTYGGYVVEQVVNEAGGCSRPFGDSRRGPSEMWYAMDFAQDVLRSYQRQQDAAS